MTYGKNYFRMVGIALLPALGVSVVVILVGGLFDLSESVVERVSQILFFPTFLGTCYFIKSRQPQQPGHPVR